ncbi:MAG: hypothetical protein L0271_20010, partial [Gemmatimonadetes bacterium]|nr:hypothetical protein [Gemmatimonadota bacterium]
MGVDVVGEVGHARAELALVVGVAAVAVELDVRQVGAAALERDAVSLAAAQVDAAAAEGVGAVLG